ncbi:hypothetical protein BDW62DRAFT_206201 [Aspergillus aurantiobrunneus]
MSNYVIAASFNPELVLNKDDSKEVSNDLTTLLRSKGYLNYEVRTGRRASDGAWRICVVLLGPWAQMPDETHLEEVRDFLGTYISPETVRSSWVWEWTDCEEVLPDWNESLEDEIMLSWDAILGEIY